MSLLRVSHLQVFSLLTFSAMPLACGTGDGTAFSSNDPSGSGAGASGSGGSTAASGTGTGATGSGGSATACPSNATATGLLLWTSLDDAASVTQPQAGSGMGATFLTTPPNDFVPALTGSGIQLDEDGEMVRFQQVGTVPNLEFDRGAIDFCYQPAYDHTDGLNHGLFGTGVLGGGGIRIRKAATDNGNALEVIVVDTNGVRNAGIRIPSTDYAFVAGTFYRLTISWDFTVAQGQNNLHLYLDGNELIDPMVSTGPVTMPGERAAEFLYIGAVGTDQPWNAGGVVDEFKLYDNPILP